MSQDDRKIIMNVVTPDGKEIHTITQFPFSVGRSSDAKIKLKLQNISRVHVVGEMMEDQLWLADQNSSNGTFVNGRKMEPLKPFVVTNKDIVTLGKSDVILTFTLPQGVNSSSHNLMAEAQKQADQILMQARRNATEIVLKAESEAHDAGSLLLKKAEEESQKLRRTTREDCERMNREQTENGQRILREAREQAEKLKSKALAEATAQKEKELEEKIPELLKKHKDLTEQVAHLEKKNKSALESFNKSLADLKAVGDKLEHDKLAADRNSQDLGEMQKAKDQLQAEIEQLQTAKVDCMRELDVIEGQLNNAKEKSEIELKEFRNQTDQSLQKLREESESRVQDFLDAEKVKMNKARAEMLSTLAKDKDQLAAEIHQKFWASITSDIQQDFYQKHDASTLETVRNAISERLGATSGVEDTAEESLLNMQKLARKQKYKHMTSGFAAGLAVLGCAWYVSHEVEMKSYNEIMAAQQQEREAELAARKYEPEQTLEVRDSYTDSVLFTKGFTDLYLDDQVQEEWLKKSSDYMFKKWRFDEEKTIMLLGLTRSLVSALNERRANIHPDFVDQNIAKMRELEEGSIEQIKEILGTKSKYASFRKLEKGFFESKVSTRTPTSASKDEDQAE
ncbi:MAG: FHA domain-containing protein [Bdellovibrionales bacterium]